MSDIIPVTSSDSKILSDRGYAFVRLLGEGSYARVWLTDYVTTVEDVKRSCSLACKIIDSKKAPRDFVNRFLPREMDILTKISHPHLIHLHSIYQRKTKFFIFMRFAERGDLLDYILANGEVKEKQARLWTRQLALGLQYLHNLEIVHRDIKCENVLITINNNVKLADFGFSRFMVDTSGKRFLSNTYCGSLAYAAPELLKGKPYDPKHSDVWSLGVVIYVMLNQCMPFNDSDMAKLYELQMNSKWTFRSKISQIVSEDVKAVVSSMLIPDPLQRIIIDDIVNHRWFACDERLRVMNAKEREALEIGLRNKSEMIPKTTRLSMPSWKKRRKDEQVVCVTSLRMERSSNQFAFEQVTRQMESLIDTKNSEDKPGPDVSKSRSKAEAERSSKRVKDDRDSSTKPTSNVSITEPSKMRSRPEDERSSKRVKEDRVSSTKPNTSEDGLEVPTGSNPKESAPQANLVNTSELKVISEIRANSSLSISSVEG